MGGGAGRLLQSELEGKQREVIVLRPLYAEGKGDGTEIFLRTGQRLWLGKHIRTVRTALARYYGVDIVALRRKYGPLLARSGSLPLPLAPRLILVPLRLRRPRLKGDAAFGYVSYHDIKGVRETAGGPSPTLLRLTSGTELPVLSQRRLVVQHLGAARMVEALYLKHTGWGLELESNSLRRELVALLREMGLRYEVSKRS